MPLRAFLMLLPVLGSGPSGGTHVAWYPSLGGVRIPRGYPEDSPWTWLFMDEPEAHSRAYGWTEPAGDATRSL